MRPSWLLRRPCDSFLAASKWPPSCYFVGSMAHHPYLKVVPSHSQLAQEDLRKALELDPHNGEVRKLYATAKALQKEVRAPQLSAR